MLRSIPALAVLLLFTAPLSAEDWTGKTIKVKEDGLKLGRKLGGGLARDGAALDKSKTYTVKSDDGTFLEVDGGFLFRADAEVVAEAKPYPKEFKPEKPGDKPEFGGWPRDTQVMFTRPPDQVPFGDWVEGKQVQFPLQFPTAAVVLPVVKDHAGGWVRIFDGKREGWVRKEHLVAVADALGHWDRVIKATPGDTFALYMRGCVHAFKGDSDKSVADYSEVIKLDPRYAAAYEARGSARLRKNEADKALADFNEAIKIDPKNVLALIGRGNVWMVKNEADKGIADFTEVIKLMPTFADPYRCRGDLWMDKKETDKALADYSEAIKHDPKNVPAVLARGSLLMTMNEHDKALADYTEAIKLDPKNVNALIGRGNVMMERNEVDKALADFNEVVKLDPTFAPALLTRGTILMTKKEYTKALADFTEAVKIDPKSAAAHSYRGYALAKLKKYADAVDAFEKAVTLEPGADDLAEYASFRASCPDAKYRDGKKAVDMAKKAVSKAGKDEYWGYADVLAMAYAEAGDFELAVAEQRKALDLLKAEKYQDKDDLKKVEARLKLYREKKPYRDEE